MRTVSSDGVGLLTEQSGDGTPVVLAHGLTATRRYVVHGSRLLERSGFRTVSYDARGHGESDPAAAAGDYEYSDLVADLEQVMDASGIERAILAGVSMGAATTLAFALQHPERVSALVQITPAHLGLSNTDAEGLARWDAIADALERGGTPAFMEALGDPPIDERFRGLVKEAVRQRMDRHLHPEALAGALRVVTRSIAFDGPGALASLDTPTLIVASRDELDPEHPLEIAERYAELIPDSELIVEEPASSPIAWRGAQLSRAMMDFVRDREVV